jgi:hypothetical protein
MSFDLDAAVAAEDNSPFEFTYQGQAFTIPLSLTVSTIEKLAEYAQDDLVNTLKTLLGEDQGTRFLALDPTDKHIQLLVKAYGDAKGVSLGEASK